MKLIMLPGILLVIILIFLIWNLKGTHIIEITINKPYNEVWLQFSNPLNYESLYPNWIKSVWRVDDTTYHMDDQFGGSYDVKLISDRTYGVVDLQIGKEFSRTRLFSLDENNTLVTHFAKRWDNLGFIPWFFHKITIWRDFRNAKRVIEQ